MCWFLHRAHFAIHGEAYHCQVPAASWLESVLFVSFVIQLATYSPSSRLSIIRCLRQDGWGLFNCCIGGLRWFGSNVSNKTFFVLRVFQTFKILFKCFGSHLSIISVSSQRTNCTNARYNCPGMRFNCRDRLFIETMHNVHRASLMTGTARLDSNLMIPQAKNIHAVVSSDSSVPYPEKSDMKNQFNLYNSFMNSW